MNPKKELLWVLWVKPESLEVLGARSWRTLTPEDYPNTPAELPPFMLPRACMGIAAWRHDLLHKRYSVGFKVLGWVELRPKLRSAGLPVEGQGCKVSMWKSVMFGRSICVFKLETRTAP